MSQYDPPTYAQLRDLPHYYGDYVRILFVATAILQAVAIPVLGLLLPLPVLWQVASILVLILLAGVTNPHSKGVQVLDAAVAAVGALLLELTAIAQYSDTALPIFVAREVAVLLLLAALYFSTKTYRAMLLGKMGHADKPWEFDEPEQPRA